MAILAACVLAGIIYGVIRLFHFASCAVPPELIYKKESQFAKQIIKMCSILTLPYVPTLMWGKSGHFQTIFYGKYGRIKSPFPKGKRHFIRLPDGATMTYDVFEPIKTHATGDFTIVVSPGIANSSETKYICTFVHYAQEHGYRVAVQNHLGAVLSIALTSPRIFNYGETEEYHTMVEDISKLYPCSQLLAVGFSMGANIVTKYLGENSLNQEKFLCGMSICQGYDIQRACQFFLDWAHFRRLYAYFMTSYQKFLIRHHYKTILTDDIRAKYSIDENKIFAATVLSEIDQAYTIKRWGYSNLDDYYKVHSCSNYINNINIPMFLLNALDDPLVPPPLLTVGKQFTETHDNCLMAVTRHGGHLGYFEGGYLTPDPITWLDRVIIEFADAAVSLLDTKKNL